MPPSLYEIRSSPIHGQGMFAMANIPEGAVIIEEPCLAAVPAVERDGEIAWEPVDAIKAYENLQPTQKKAFEELHGDGPWPRGSIVKKWMLNSFQWPQRAFSGIFLEISRINHSCRRNSFLSYDGALGKIMATRNISKGEEIFISYIERDPPFSQQERQEKLESYGIECRCQACVQYTTTG